MTERRFYAGIAMLPVLLPVIAGAIAHPSMRAGASEPATMIRIASLVYLAGVLSIVPYAIALGIVIWRTRSARHANFRRITWCLPLLIAVMFAPAFAAMSGTGTDIAAFGAAMLVGGLWALVVGYCYALLIELLRFLGKRLDWIASDSDPAY